MLLHSENMPQNELLAKGFDMTYLGRRHGLFVNEEVISCLHETIGKRMRALLRDCYVLVRTVWPYEQPVGSFGTGSASMLLVQAKVPLPQQENVTILGPTDRLKRISLMEIPQGKTAVATLGVWYGNATHTHYVEQQLATNGRKH